MRRSNMLVELTGSKTLSNADFAPASRLLPQTLTGDGKANTLTGGRMNGTLKAKGRP